MGMYVCTYASIWCVARTLLVVNYVLSLWGCLWIDDWTPRSVPSGLLQRSTESWSLPVLSDPGERQASGGLDFSLWPNMFDCLCFGLNMILFVLEGVESRAWLCGCYAAEVCSRARCFWHSWASASSIETVHYVCWWAFVHPSGRAGQVVGWPNSQLLGWDGKFPVLAMMFY